jgi:hypothetical protein
LSILALAMGGMATAACSADGHGGGEADAVATSSEAIWPESLLEKTLVPLRPLVAPGNVYFTGIDQRIDGSGTWTQTFHVYQPDTNGEGIRFEVAAKTSTGAIDGAHSFQSVTVTSRPGEPDESQQTLWNSNGNGVYSVATSRQGWYRFRFTYVAPNFGRTLTFRAVDGASTSLKIVWSDPPSARVQVKGTVQVQQAGRVFLKGGAYRNATASQSAFADHVTVDGRLLYRRSFDQGAFNFPLGWLPAGPHSVEFSLQANSYNPAKFWFGIDEKSFDPLARFTEWNPVQFLYYGEMHTGDYDAWNEGVAFAQGTQPGRGVRPAPVRRGTSFGVALDHSSLSGGTANATLRVYRLGGTTPLVWTATKQTNGDYSGGIFTNTGFASRSREHWRVAVPVDAPVGRYVLRAIAPSGAQIGSDVAFYVIHNPYSLVASGRLTKPELDTYAYDEDEDGVNMKDAPFGSDADAQRDHFTAIYYGNPAAGEFSPDSKVTGAFRRTSDDPLALSVLDYVMAAGDGTTSEFDTMRRVLRLVSQQYRYGGSDRSDDTASLIVSSSEEPSEGWSLAGAALYSQPGNELLYPGQAVCYTMASILPAHARAAGIPARSVTAVGLGGWAEHAFAEVFVSDLPRHGGTTSSSPTSPNSDTDPWYVFDATDPGGTGNSPTWLQHSQALSPRAQYGRTGQIIHGFSEPFYTTTSPVVWDFREDSVLTTNALSVTAQYASGPDYWLSRSGITGWLGYWERDVYRVNKAATGATRVSVRTLPNDGEYLQPRLCIAPVTNDPPMPERCPSPATSVDLPAGDSYVIVFNGTDPLPVYRGDSVQYVLELQ